MTTPSAYASEDQFQAAAFAWWNKHFRRISLLFAVPNGGSRIFEEALVLQATGTTAGVYDLQLVAQGGRLAMIELKNGVGIPLGDSQKKLKPRLDHLGIPNYLAGDLLEFQQAVCHHLGVELAPYL